MRTTTTTRDFRFMGQTLKGLDADDLRALVDAAWFAAQEAGREAPSVKAVPVKDGVELHCPHCGALNDSLYDQDVAVRWNSLHVNSPINTGDKCAAYVTGFYDGNSDFEGQLFIAPCCDRAVSLPDDVQHEFI